MWGLSKKAKYVVIPNGTDTDLFGIVPEYRAQFRQELGTSEDTFLVGRVCRYRTIKNIPLFLDACKLFLEQQENARFVLVGPGMDAQNTELVGDIHKRALQGHVFLLGNRSDLPVVYNGLDVHCSSSLSEACPNVLREAMACGIPCVATDVGNSRLILGSLGVLTETEDAQGLADGFTHFLHNKADPQALRQHIEKNFSMERMIEQYEAVWREVAAPSRRG